MKYFKEYILIVDWVDIGHAVNTAAHAALVGHKEWSDDEIYDEWFVSSFRKVTCKVSQEEFNKAKLFDDHKVITESAFDNKEVALVFKPREDWPGFFKS
jgi:hypothetical protein